MGGYIGDEGLPSSSSQSGSITEGRVKRSKSSKKDKKESKHKKSKEKKSKNEKKLLKEAKKYLKTRLQESTGTHQQATHSQEEVVPGTSAQPIELLTSDDYFTKNPEFTSWLRVKHGRSFNDLAGDESHALFEKFVDDWNKGLLPKSYYAGLAGTTVRTTHNWALKGASAFKPENAIGLGAAMQNELLSGEDRRRDARQQEKEERKKWMMQQKVDLDELLPKATGKEARIEAKVARREAEKARAESPDAVHVPGGRGGVLWDGDSFEAARDRESKRQEYIRKRKLAENERLNQRVSALQATEDAKMAAFRALAAKGPIQIPKRTE